ncbi:hypothetical protein BDV12DRAFT_211330 [Aspergillus spectabilis]
MLHSPPKRTHSFGGCKPCRTRHLKCDQTAPQCNRCQISGLECDYSPALRWVVATGPEVYENLPQFTGPTEERTARRYLYSKYSREVMSRLLIEGVPGTVVKVLDDVDERAKDLDGNGSDWFAAGPFSVFKSDLSHCAEAAVSSLAGTVTSAGRACSPLLAPAASENIKTRPFASITHADAVESIQPTPRTVSQESSNPGDNGLSEGQYLDDLLASPIDLLQWGDLFAQSADFPILDIQNGSNAQVSFSIWPVDNDTPYSQTQLSGLDPKDPGWPQLDLTAEAPLLLRHFNDEVIDQMGSLPINEKSPWRTLSFPLALVTLSDLTVLDKNRNEIKQANLANYYALIAVSAFHLALNSVAFPALERRENYWRELSRQTYEAAKCHLHYSLANEYCAPRKAKYKEQLIAIGAILATAILSGSEMDTRQYLTEMEHLIRSRGLKKPNVSRRARSLHNVYAWMRIVSESTNVAYEQRVMPTRPGVVQHTCHIPPIPTMGHAINADIPLDNFLHLQPQQLPIDPTNDTHKEQNGQDIHFVSSLQSHGNMYMQIYGVPETWLSLVSQTTRLANVIDRLSPGEKSRDADILASIQPRASYLENAVCLFRSRHCSSTPTPSSSQCTNAQQTKPHTYMVEALSSALVVFFFRRIRNTNPLLLQDCVNHVICSLHAWDKALIQHGLLGPGTAWPAFVAGAEAITGSQRENIVSWLDNAFSKAGWAGYRSSKEILSEVWRRRDQSNAGATTCIATWMDVCRDMGKWPILC